MKQLWCWNILQDCGTQNFYFNQSQQTYLAVLDQTNLAFDLVWIQWDWINYIYSALLTLRLIMGKRITRWHNFCKFFKTHFIKFPILWHLCQFIQVKIGTEATVFLHSYWFLKCINVKSQNKKWHVLYKNAINAVSFF